MRNLALFSSLALVAGASAQTLPLDKGQRFRAEIGLFFPTGLPSGIDRGVGLSLALGGDYTIKEIDALGDDATLSIGSVLATGRYRFSGSKAYAGFGLGLGFGEGRIDVNGYNDSSDIEFIDSVEGGYDFTKSFYGLVRYQGARPKSFKGVTVGYRF